MADHTLRGVIPKFPAGTTVGAYLRRSSFVDAGKRRPPTDVATTTAVVASDGTLAFAGLGETQYVAYAQVGGDDRFIDFETRIASEFQGPQGPRGDPGPQGDPGLQGIPGDPTADPELNAIAALASTAGKGIRYTGSGVAELIDITAFAKTLLDDADAAAARATLGAAAASHSHAESDITGLVADLAAKQPLDADLTAIAALTTTGFGRSILEVADAAAARTLIGAQQSDNELSALAGLTSAANKVPYFTGSGTAALADLTAFARTLLDDADAATALATLGAQALDTDLTAIAALTSAADKIAYATGAGTWALTDFTATARSLLDDTSTAAMLTTLGAIAASLVDAKGDILTATADNTPARLAVGADGQHLKAASGQSTGLQWVSRRDIHSFAIKTPATGVYPGFMVTLGTNQGRKIVAVRYKTDASTATVTLNVNGSAAHATYTGLSVTSTAATATQDVTLAASDLVELNVTAVGSPDRLTVTVFTEPT